MITLGIDPGSRLLGYGLVRSAKGGVRTFVDAGVLKLASTDNHLQRLAEIYRFIVELVEKHGPDVCAIEMPVYATDPQAVLKLGRVQAACMLAALHREVPVTEYTPKEIKRAVTGNGNASKEQVRYMVEQTLGITLADTLSLDTSDALGVALCHSQKGLQGLAGGSKNWAAFVRDNPERIK